MKNIKIAEIYEILEKKFGNLNWWPIDNIYHKKNSTDQRFEIIIGAILTQNTAWSNVEKALKNLKEKNKLDIRSILEIQDDELKKLIRPSGFFNQKSKRLKNISRFFSENYNSNLDLFFKKDTKKIRKELLEINGIGKETADSILLYAGKKPIFVVDLYTKRLCKRLPIKIENSYDPVQKYFEKKLKKKYEKKELFKVYNQMHALIVELSKKYCKKTPICKNCPLNKHCQKRKIKLF